MHSNIQPFIYRVNDADTAPKVLLQVFHERGWVPFDERLHGRNQWNLWWKANRWPATQLLPLLPGQVVNHITRGGRISRKDVLARELRCMRRVYGSIYNFSPPAFILPHEFLKFVAEYNKPQNSKDNFWICKPTDQSCGHGILIFNNINDLIYSCNVVVQKYISRPFLISGYKFDLRLYVCVPSFRPLIIYVHRCGLVRFGTETYSLSVLQNVYSHLTNTSINKFSPTFDDGKGRVGPGCKWRLSQLRQFFQQIGVNDWGLWQRISSIITLTLLCQVGDIPRTTNNFELYGLDIIVDCNLRPWLLEVNRHPSLNQDSEVDVDVKKRMLHDLLDLLGLGTSLSTTTIYGKGLMTPAKNSTFPATVVSIWPDVTLPPRPQTPPSKKKVAVGIKKSSKGCKVSRRGNTPAFNHCLHGLKQQKRQDSISKDSTSPSSTEEEDNSLHHYATPALSESCEEFYAHQTADCRPANHPSFRWNNPPQKVGQFVRTFPFNRKLRKACADVVNLRPIVIEVQNAVRASEAVVRSMSERQRPATDEECSNAFREMVGSDFEIWLPDCA